jgi:hypothetical protein
MLTPTTGGMPTVKVGTTFAMPTVKVGNAVYVVALRGAAAEKPAKVRTAPVMRWIQMS